MMLNYNGSFYIILSGIINGGGHFQAGYTFWAVIAKLGSNLDSESKLS